MKIKYLLLALVCLPALSFGQQVVPFPTAPMHGTGAPSGFCSPGSLYTNDSNGTLYSCDAGAWASVVAGSTLTFPITVVNGVSGGIPYFNSTVQMSASAILAANALMVGGGAGSAPLTGNADFTYTTHTLASGATGIVDFSAVTSTAGFKVPIASGNTASANGVIDFDSSNGNYHGYVNGADSIFANFATAPSNGRVISATLNGGNVLLSDAGFLASTVVRSASPGVGIAHFAGSTQIVTSSAVNLANADVTGVLPLANITRLFQTNPQTATYQTVSSDFVGCKTIPVASGTFTITLVASGSQPATGQCIYVINYGSGVVTIAPSGQNINGLNSNLTLTAGSAAQPTGIFIVSDGTNYEAQLYGAGSGGGGAYPQAVSGAVASGGIPYFSTATQQSSSGVLTAGYFVLGGGAGGAPTTPFGVVPSASGGTGIASPNQNSIMFGGGSSAVGLITPPSTQGNYNCGYNVSSFGSVPPTCLLVGLTNRAIIGAASTDTVTYSDNSGIVEHDQNATTAVNETLPTPSVLQNTGFIYSYANHTSSLIDTITPNGSYTINGSPSLSINPGVFCRVTIDTNSASNWLADCSGLSGSNFPYTVLTDAATISWPVGGSSSNAKITLGGNRTLSISGAPNGWHGNLFINQGTGNHTLAIPAGSYVQNAGGGVLTLSTAANAQDLVRVTYDGANFWWDSPLLNYTAVNQAFGVNNAVSQESSAATATTVTISISSGHTAVINCGQGANSTSTATITDSGGNTYMQSASGYSVSTGARASGMWYSYLASSVTSVTCTWTGSLSALVRATVFDVIGTATSSIEDSSVNSSNASSGTTYTSGSLTTSNANDILLFGTNFSGGTVTAGSGYTIPSGGQIAGGNAHSAMQYQIVSSTQSAVTTSMTDISSTPFTGVFLALKKHP
jgi:hypothetical protein